MNKKIIIATAAALVVVGGAYVGATAYVGQRFQDAYAARIDKLQKELPFVQIVDRRVERSLFTATYSATVRVGCAASGSMDPTVVITDQVRHGPLPGFSHFAAAIVDSRIQLPDSAPQDLRGYLAGLPPDAIRTRIGFDGGYSTAVRLPAGQIAESSGKASWPAFAMSGSGRVDGSATQFDANLPELAFTVAGSKGASVKLTGIRMQGNTHGPANSLWLRQGSSSMDIDSLEVRSDSERAPVTARLTNLKYAAEVTGAKDLLDGKVALSADASIQLGRDAQPFELDKVEVVESFKRLHAPTLESFIAGSMRSLPNCETSASGNTESATPPDEKDEMRAARAQEMLKGLLQLLPHDPEFAVDRIAFTHAGRRGELSYSVGIKDFALKDGETLAKAQPRLMNALIVKARATLPAPWVKQLSALAGDEAGADDRALQATMLLEMALSKNYAVRNADDITSELLFERGVATLNGKPLGR